MQFTSFRLIVCLVSCLLLKEEGVCIRCEAYLHYEFEMYFEMNQLHTLELWEELLSNLILFQFHNIEEINNLIVYYMQKQFNNAKLVAPLPPRQPCCLQKMNFHLALKGFHTKKFEILRYCRVTMIKV
jgi:hypothetical protein